MSPVAEGGTQTAARAVVGGRRVQSQIGGGRIELPPPGRDGGAGDEEGELRTVRIAAVGDLHYDGDNRQMLSEVVASAAREADILVICGDLTTHGEPRQAEGAAEALVSSGLPVVMVLGNHDFESDKVDQVVKVLTARGIHVLDGSTVEIFGVGFAGVKGFAGGFGRGSLGAFGEPLIKAFVQEAVNEALKLENALRSLRSPVRIVVLHYAPHHATLVGEPEVIFPYLGSSRLLPPIDTLGADAVFHGHAHTGTLEGQTPGGIPLYNVALPVLMAQGGAPFLLWEAQVPVRRTAEELAHGAVSRR